MKTRRLLLTLFGASLAIVYAAGLSLVAPGQHSATVRRGALLLLVMGCYGWCFGGERHLATRWLVLDLLLMPLALAGAAIAGIVFAVSSAIRWLCSLVGR
ncbi:MAG: hypothetical protein PHO07_02500 [Pirellulales bacterium]|jgi:hypothetical protein|nr:hypothetical protein [Thermoguttaceae bacterium]MDD4786017.1 hypothetical protein [Pirellulales bacterium]MDI9446799.1 hypothetical protein [Planctomycetota bacterium]NLY99719.1 hypothetical protein [Pirellulaceae bacterium]